MPPKVSITGPRACDNGVVEDEDEQDERGKQKQSPSPTFDGAWG
jgi:hypothetical protein